MAFLLRTVTHSAEGREIVRTARIEGDRLSFGRDPASHVHLTDLAVALHHGELQRVAPGRIAVQAAEGLSVEVNGRKCSQAELQLGTGGEIRIASHLLRIAPTPADAEDIAIDVERTGETASDPAGEARRFALASVMPGKRPLAWALSLLVLGLFLAWPIYAYQQRETQAERTASFQRYQADSAWISGHLSAAHRSLEQDCAACHVNAFEPVQDAACTSCHTRIHDHAEAPRMAAARAPVEGGLARVQQAFRSAFGVTDGRCVECHTEHEGPQRLADTSQRFCADCHGDLSARLADTRIGDAGDFGRHHPEFRPLVLTRWEGEQPLMERIAQGRRPREDSNLKFPHALHLSRTNGVAQMARRLGARHGFGEALACADCHVPTPDGVRFQPVRMEEDCAMCHSLAFDTVGGTVRTLRHGAPDQVVADLREFFRGRGPARPAELGGMARRRPGEAQTARTAAQFSIAQAAAPRGADAAIRAVFTRGGACYDCHRIDPPAGGGLGYRIRPVAFPTRYFLKGWFDHRPHAQETCVSCHAAPRSNASADLLLPDLASCRECHGGEGSRADVPSGCAMCHDYHADEGAPAMLLRKRVHGRRWTSTVIPIETGTDGPVAGRPAPAPAAAERR
jgi:predicted CXXCH cytochrome family protein